MEIIKSEALGKAVGPKHISNILAVPRMGSGQHPGSDKECS